MLAKSLFKSFPLPLIPLQSAPSVLFDVVRKNVRSNFRELRCNFAC